MSYDHTILKGTTSKIVEVMLRDGTTGAGKTAVAHTDVTASYVREGATRTAITLASGTAGDAYSSGKWAEVDSTNCPGLYQLHLPNASLATGVNAVTTTLTATGVIDKVIRISLLDVDLRDSTDAGLSRLDAAISSRSSHAATDIVSGGAITTSGGAVSNVTTVATTTTNADMRGTDAAFLAASAPANFAALGINASGHVSRVTTVDTTTANSDMRGTDGANTVVPDNTAIAAILVDTGTTIPDTLAGLSVLTEPDVTSAAEQALTNYEAVTATDLTARTLLATNYATAANLQTVDNNVDAILLDTNELQTKLIPMLELDGAVYRYTANALEEAPSGGGGGGDCQCGNGAYQLTIDVQNTEANDLQGAQAEIVGTELKVTTGTDGTAIINLNDGTYTLRLSAPSGYVDPADRTIVINEADTTENYTLAATAEGDCNVSEI